MRTSRLWRILMTALFVISALSLPAVAKGQQVEKVSICQLVKDPPAYNHKLVQVTGFVSNGFEDSSLFDPACPASQNLWIECGGTVNCGDADYGARKKELEVEQIPIPLVNDDRFGEFDQLLQRKPDSVVHATIVGRFFSGWLTRLPGGSFWTGYGHLACCSLLAIQQILSVDPHDRQNLDYGYAPDQPMAGRVGCTYWWLRFPGFGKFYRSAIEAQRAADAGSKGWAFDDPRRVAIDFLARQLKSEDRSVQGIKQTGKSQGRVIYEWKPPKNRMVTYATVVSRPYWLSFYSRDPRHVAWIVLGAFKSSCDKAAR